MNNIKKPELIQSDPYYDFCELRNYLNEKYSINEKDFRKFLEWFGYGDMYNGGFYYIDFDDHKHIKDSGILNVLKDEFKDRFMKIHFEW